MPSTTPRRPETLSRSEEIAGSARWARMGVLTTIFQEPNHRKCNARPRGGVSARAAAAAGGPAVSGVRDGAGQLPQLATAGRGAPRPRAANLPGAAVGPVHLRRSSLPTAVLHPADCGGRPARPHVAPLAADRGRAVPPRQGRAPRGGGRPADLLPHRDRQVQRAALAPAEPQAGLPAARAAAVLGGAVHRRGLRSGGRPIPRRCARSGHGRPASCAGST